MCLSISSTSAKQGGGRHWTWCIQDAHYADLETAMRRYTSAHGGRDRQERRDDPEWLVAAIRRMPGFHGIRRQQWALFTLGKNCWDRTHKTPCDGWPTKLPYVDKRQPVYHRPETLRLDVLVQLQARRGNLVHPIQDPGGLGLCPSELLPQYPHNTL